MPIPPRLHRGEVYHARVPPAALFAPAQNVATFMEAFRAIDALAWPAGAVGVVSKRLVRKNEKKSLPVPVSFTIIGNHAGVAELADAYGSGPYGGNPVKVQVLSPAPLIERAPAMGLFSCPDSVLDARGARYARSARCARPFSDASCWGGAGGHCVPPRACPSVCPIWASLLPCGPRFPQMNKNQSFATHNE